jgi:hypothetical protein
MVAHSSYFYILLKNVCSTRVWTLGLSLVRQVLYHLSHTPAWLVVSKTIIYYLSVFLWNRCAVGTPKGWFVSAPGRLEDLGLESSARSFILMLS